MTIKLKQPFASNGEVDDYDVRQMKKMLNRLGYYTPYDKTGITGIPDAEVFQALKEFQRDNGLPPTGEARPSDDTVQALNDAMEKNPEGQYIWRTVGDDKVRDAHAQYNGTVRDFSDSPDPGEDYNCRCWAEPVSDAINPVYPELILIPALKLGRIFKIVSEFFKRSDKKDFTDHGSLRSGQRKASQKQIQEAIRTAKETGNVTTKTGKYGTPQNVYRGSNGLTVVEETEGRNAGKIITIWWH